MLFQPLELSGLFLIKPRVFEDPRGWFYEGYKQHVFAEHEIRDAFVQDNYSFSSKGVLRGLHYQLKPKAQAKLVQVLQGSALDVVVDIRKSSKTFGKYFSCRLDGKSHEMLFIPEGFAHGFCALEDNTIFMYKVSNRYSPEHERGIFWNDTALHIPWPKMEYIFSEKDQKYPALKDAEIFT
jgi:dTDP-4-dehydrorhamnose 3,5-epimerase